MIISTQTDCLASVFGIERAVEIISCAGFDAIDISLFTTVWENNILSRNDFMEYARHLKCIAKQNGTYFNQAHAPFPSFRQDDEAYNAFIFPAIIKSIEFSAEIGASQIIVHPFVTQKDQKANNLEFYNSLLPYCKEYGIKVALENMFGRNKRTGHLCPNVCSTGIEFCEYLDELDSEYFTACLDIGHAGLVGESAVNMIHTLGHDRLTALHVHDNNKVNDLHTLPFTRELDFDQITAALKDIKYSGDFTLEADHFLLQFPEEIRICATRLMAETARYLADRCE